MLTLYHGPTSVCSQKVRVALAELGLSYESRLLDLQKGDQYAPDYLRLNPAAVVPTLVDDGLVVVESSLILDHLDRERGGGRLSPMGREPEVTAAHWLLRTLDIHAAVNTLSFSTAMRANILASRTADEIAQMMARMPDPVARMKRRTLLEEGLAAVFVEQALRQLRRTFADMQLALGQRRWMMGETFSKVDVALVAYVDRIERLGFAGLWLEEFPAIARWLAAMQARPSYAAGIAAFADPVGREKMRQGGSAHWPELARQWEGLR
ncbi:glutathione S-transferase family protein [Salipiger mangrovisoli]|uniref:Glutathione S-transferase family protein n=1 Tax=Salipiger mangrovisoli TaxID=2865933 RepID=A0ABR9X109_9RHOB|nr:glutathione S-transferase family protein [Salipiger mangrovisoli]MBE9637186.1 glutathione S-transferase family protein [Salipiger mangrovisoli]